MTHIARNLTGGVDGFFKGKRYLIYDRDPLYTREFSSILAEAISNLLPEMRRALPRR
jgi:hypothetical protein